MQPVIPTRYYQSNLVNAVSYHCDLTGGAHCLLLYVEAQQPQFVQGEVDGAVFSCVIHSASGDRSLQQKHSSRSHEVKQPRPLLLKWLTSYLHMLKHPP